MRLILLVIGLIGLGSVNSVAQESTRQPRLERLIDSLFVVDQQVQQVVMSAQTDSARQRLLQFVPATFSRHQPLLADVIKEYGYPGFRLVGPEGSHHFFVLVQHCDSIPRFQQRVLRLMRKAVSRQDADGKWYGYLVDRVALNAGKLQVYGTQITFNGQQALPKPLRKPATVNQRRAKLGMEPLEAYLAKATEFHHKINKH